MKNAAHQTFKARLCKGFTGIHKVTRNVTGNFIMMKIIKIQI